MAWNHEPEVAVARDYGKRFGFDMVLIIGVTNGKIGCASYGKTMQECRAAKVLGKEATDAVGRLIGIHQAMIESGVA